VGNKRQALRLAEDMKHVEAVLKMLDPGFNARSISTHAWFKRGTMFRHALEALRAAPGQMTVRELVDAIHHGEAAKDLQASLRASPGGHEGKTVERVGAGIAAIV
jgi:hypothetical protein